LNSWHYHFSHAPHPFLLPFIMNLVIISWIMVPYSQVLGICMGKSLGRH
jgi:hypothetical protein